MVLNGFFRFSFVPLFRIVLLIRLMGFLWTLRLTVSLPNRRVCENPGFGVSNRSDAVHCPS